MSKVAVDTSVAVPYVMASHTAHALVRQRLAECKPVLTGHSMAESYSVLTRLPGDARLAPTDAASLLEATFAEPALLDPSTTKTLPRVLAEVGVAGGAVYDAMVALAAKAQDLELATRDARARATYDAIGVRVRVITG